MFYDEVASLAHQFPGFSIKPKGDSKICKVLNAILWVLTFGTTKFMTNYITVLGKTVYVPAGWNQYSWLSRWIILRHEGVHLQQAKRTGLGCFWFGWVIWSFAYLFVLPLGITFRARWEREAYEESIRCSQRFGVPLNRSKLFDQFVGSQYFWMDLRRDDVSRWLDRMGVS
jgi:hypothetical protein